MDTTGNYVDRKKKSRFILFLIDLLHFIAHSLHSYDGAVREAAEGDTEKSAGADWRQEMGGEKALQSNLFKMEVGDCPLEACTSSCFGRRGLGILCRWHASLCTCWHTSRKPHRCGMRTAWDAQSNRIGIITEEILRRAAPPGEGSSQISNFGSFWNKTIILLLTIYGCTRCSLESTGWQTVSVVLPLWHGFRNSQLTLVRVNGPAHSGGCLQWKCEME